jgi:DNA polymerase III delta prime subunit
LVLVRINKKTVKKGIQGINKYTLIVNFIYFTKMYSNLLLSKGIQEISFNPIATTFVLKHLEKIVKTEASHFNVDKDFLNEVCLISDGDLRQALNILELSQHNPKVPSLTRTEPVKRVAAVASGSSKSSKTSKQKQTTRGEPSENCLIQKKDANFSIFRGLGKKWTLWSNFMTPISGGQRKVIVNLK